MRTISGVIPQLAAVGDAMPIRTENGIGALMPWAGRLWFITYVSGGPGTGAGAGLYSIDADLQLDKHPASVTGTYANRMLHPTTNQIVIGPHLICLDGGVRTFEALVPELLTATCEHLTEPSRKVYFLTMNGLFFEADVETLEVKRLANLCEELDLPDRQTWHFKGAHTACGRVVVANNSYDERDYRGEIRQGRLAEWNGEEWTVLENSPFNEVAGRRNWGQAIFAAGWDRASALLCVFAAGKWTRYRLPKASHAWEHYWQTEWPRIREVESERYLLDCHAMFYELSPVVWGGRVWGVRPISTHLRIIPDYCTWRGMLILGGNQQTPIEDANLTAGEPQANLWFGKTDDLWGFGKPKGWGGPWWDTNVEAGVASDPYLMTGFDGKVLHLSHGAPSSVRVTVEVDFLGNGNWHVYDTFDVGERLYVHHEFPTGFSAHWVRVTASDACCATAYLTYT